MQEKKNYDSAFCGNLPLHQINQIQPYGALIVLDREFEVIQVSENLEQITGLLPAQVLNTPLIQYVKKDQFDFLYDKVHKHLNRVPGKFTFKNSRGITEVTAIIHIKELLIILELEALNTTELTRASSFIDVYHDLKVSMAAIEQAPTLQELCEVSVAEIKKLSGFDKVMIYQFDKEWNGEVLAEVMEPGMESYRGLVFPASDIPRQARALYINNPYRLIPDRNYKPVKLYPLINPLTHGFLDLSDLNLRGVASVHLEYLKNMGITASMSVRLMKPDKTLWGLISCHHLTAKHMDLGFCTIFELLSTIVSSRIISLEKTEELRFYAELQETEAQLIKQVYHENDLFRGFLENAVNVMHLFNADGVSLLFNKKLECAGKTPSGAEVQELMYWLSSKEINKVYAEDNLSAVYERGVSFAENASGILVIPVTPGKEEYMILYRQEVIQKINWGGNPSEAIRFEKDSLNYHPRNSFQIWQQTVANTSLPWKSYEINIADQVRNFILDYIIQKKVQIRL